MNKHLHRVGGTWYAAVNTLLKKASCWSCLGEEEVYDVLG